MEKNINIPNLLAFVRLVIAPLMFLLLVDRDLFPHIHSSWLDFFAAFLFVLASITDFFDGYIARTFDQITQLGKILDPLADKMLTLAGFLGLMVLDRANPWAVYLILTREFFITGLRVSAVSSGKEIAASFLGKIKTIIQMIAIGFLIMDWRAIGVPMLWLAVIITLYSGYEYIKKYLH